MTRRWLTRAVVALAVPALAVPALTTPAVAAGAPKVPSLEKVAAIYPFLAGGQAMESTSSVKGVTKKCKSGKPVKGASARYASYLPSDPAASGTADSPYLSVAALRFRSPKDAVAYLRGANAGTKCPAVDLGTGEKVKVKVKKLAFKLGDERWGYTVTAKFSGRTYITQSLLAREGKVIVTASASASDGSTPSSSKAIKLAKVTLKTAS
jgi:hypothetical protein